MMMVCQGPGRFFKGFKFSFIHFEWLLNGITKDIIKILWAIIKVQKDVISLNKYKRCIALYSQWIQWIYAKCLSIVD